MARGDKQIIQGHNLSKMIHGKDDLLSSADPAFSDRQALFPSEQWFTYWKTSARLWESQLSTSADPLVNIPINWAFHNEDGETSDFGQERPETDLAKLAIICEKLHKEILFFLPLTPLPFFAHGGVPRLLARSQARDLAGIAHAYMDWGGRVSKFYSFFDPRVFVAFQKYIRQLEQHFSRQGIMPQVVGLLGVGIEQVGERESFVSYSEDSSLAFDQGFGRFLSASGPGETNLLSPREEWEVKHLYHQMSQQLYLETARESLEDYWLGHLDFCFLGGGPRDIFQRVYAPSSCPSKHAREAILSLIYNKIPTAALLPESSRTEGLTKFFSQVVTPATIKFQLDREREADEWGPQYDLLCAFEIHERPLRYSCHAKSWHDVGLKQYLDKAYSGIYRVNNHLEPFPVTECSSEWPHALIGGGMDQQMAKSMLRAFLNGASFIVNTADINEDVMRTLESFILQNSLDVEVVKYHIQIRRVVLGRGQLLLFDGTPLESERQETRDVFWEKVLSIFEFPYQKLELDEGVVAVWKKRPPIQSELNFEQIRRVILYNPTDFKKQAKIPAQKKFRLLRYEDEYDANVTSSGGGASVSLSADGSVAIDFGLIEV